jgi:hypothetical protein
VAQWKHTGQKGLCAFAFDVGKKRDQLDDQIFFMWSFSLWTRGLAMW